jgi:hypothetical protein
MDWLRIGAFAILIAYHIGMYFVFWDWHVKTAQPLDWLAVPMLAVNAWRIALLFVVSGYGSAALFGKLGHAGAFLRERTLRLVIPLLAGVVLFVPLQPWIELQFKHGYTKDFVSFWLGDYFRMAPLEGIMLPTWNHLWFVGYLWAYTALVGLLLFLPQRWRAWLRRAADAGLGDGRVLIVPLVALLLRLWLGWPGAEETHDFIGDGFAHPLWLALFGFGFLLRDAPATWRGIRRWWPLAAAFAIAAYALVAAIEIVWPGNAVPPANAVIALALARTVQMWSAIIALLGLADRFWNHDHPARAALTEAVFPAYIIHQTIIVGIGWVLVGQGLGAPIEALVLVAATTLGCWVFYRLGKAIGPLRPLIGLRYRDKKPETPTDAVGSASGN